MNNLILLGGIIIIFLIIILLIIIIIKLQKDVENKNNTPIINVPRSEKEFVFIKTKNQKSNRLNDKKRQIDLKKTYNNGKIGNNLERIIEEKHNLEAKLRQLEQQSKTPAPSIPNQTSTPAPTNRH
jgi:hypothetical protein